MLARQFVVGVLFAMAAVSAIEPPPVAEVVAGAPPMGVAAAPPWVVASDTQDWCGWCAANCQWTPSSSSSSSSSTSWLTTGWTTVANYILWGLAGAIASHIVWKFRTMWGRATTWVSAKAERWWRYSRIARGIRRFSRMVLRRSGAQVLAAGYRRHEFATYERGDAVWAAREPRVLPSSDEEWRMVCDRRDARASARAFRTPSTDLLAVEALLPAPTGPLADPSDDDA